MLARHWARREGTCALCWRACATWATHGSMARKAAALACFCSTSGKAPVTHRGLIFFTRELWGTLASRAHCL